MSPTTSSAELPFTDAKPQHKPSTSSILKPNKRSLGAKKATKAINFEEAERLAKEEEERRILEEEEARKRMEEAKAAQLANAFKPASSNRVGNTAVPAGPSDQVDRLGFGVGRLGFGFEAPSGPASGLPPAGQNKTNGFGSASSVKDSWNSRPTAPAQTGGFGFGAGGFGASSTPSTGSDATERFGNAKGISSDQYFGRGAYDEAEKYV